MDNERTLYISPDDDLPSICTRLEHAHCRKITLVLPVDAEHLQAFGTWRMLHAYTRRRGIRVHVVSTNPYFRSVARNARFTVTKTLQTPQQEQTVYTRPARMSISTRFQKSMNVGEDANGTSLSDDTSSPSVEQPQIVPLFELSPLMFSDDDVLLPHPDEPPVRVSKPPRPLDMPRIRRTRPLVPPRLPWDDDMDDEMLPPQPLHKPIRRRTNPLVQSMMRRRGIKRDVQRRGPVVTKNVMSLAPILCIGIFIVVRSIVQYMRKRVL